MAKNKEVSKISKIFSKFLVLIVLTLIFLITLKSNAKFKEFIDKKVFQNNFNFAQINSIYNKYFGSSLPLKDNTKAVPVSNEKLEYQKAEKYKDGAKLTVDKNYIIPSLSSGLVIFVGEKEEYGKTVVVQKPDNIEIWYSNLENTNISLYDYIKKGANIGQVKNSTLYISFWKEGKKLDYKKYI